MRRATHAGYRSCSHLLSPPRTLAQGLHAPRVMEIKERGKERAVSPKSFRLQRSSGSQPCDSFTFEPSHPTRSGSAYWPTCALPLSHRQSIVYRSSRRMTREDGRAVRNFYISQFGLLFFSFAQQPKFFFSETRKDPAVTCTFFSCRRHLPLVSLCTGTPKTSNQWLAKDRRFNLSGVLQSRLISSKVLLGGGKEDTHSPHRPDC